MCLPTPLPRSLHNLDPADLHCPRLSRLNLFGCRHITTDSLLALLNQAHGLREINVNGCNALRQIDLIGAPTPTRTGHILVPRHLAPGHRSLLTALIIQQPGLNDLVNGLQILGEGQS